MTETALPKLAYPWFAYADGKAVVCAHCRNWISDNEPRAWCAQDRACMHLECHGIVVMGDHGQAREPPTDPSRPVAATDGLESTEARIERMHKEKMAVLERIAAALEGKG